MNLNLLAATFLLSALIQYLVQKVFIHYKKFDEINHRSSHKTLATRSGGIGIFVTLFIVAVFYYYLRIDLFDYSLFIPLGIMFVVGVYDDFYDADFKLKFLLQIITAKILIDQGYVISNYHGLFGLNEVPWLLAQFTTVFVFLVLVNAINFIDGIDGLAITEVIKIILFFELFSNGPSALSSLGILVIASILPLYYFNFKKIGKVFLGDAGSLMLGTLIIVYTLNALGPKYNLNPSYLVLNKVLFSLLALLYPLIDLIRVFILRIKAGKSPFMADQNHLHHIIHKITNNQKLTLLIISTLSILIPLVIYKIVIKFVH